MATILCGLADAEAREDAMALDEEEEEQAGAPPLNKISQLKFTMLHLISSIRYGNSPARIGTRGSQRRCDGAQER